MNRRDIHSLDGPPLPRPGVGRRSPERSRKASSRPRSRPGSARHPVVLYAPERDFPPFSFVDGQGQHRGLSADVLELVQQHTGLKFQAVAAGDRAAQPGARAAARGRPASPRCGPRPSARPTCRSRAPTSARPRSSCAGAATSRSGDLARMAGERIAVDRDSATGAVRPRRGAPAPSWSTSTSPPRACATLVFGEVDADGR